MKAIFSVWQGRIAAVFDTATEVVEVRCNTDGNCEHYQHTLPALLHERIAWLQEHNATALICGALSRCWQLEIERAGIRVIPFISGTLAEVITGWQQNKLDCDHFAMPGCCGRQGRSRGCGMGHGMGRGRRRGMRQQEFQRDAAMQSDNNTQNKGE